MNVNPVLGSKYVYDPESQTFVSAKHVRIAEIINDYNPDLFLVWIPPAQRTAIDSKPFAVVHVQADGQRYPLFHLSEDELDHRVLARIFANDMSKHDPNAVLNEIELNERAQELVRAKQLEDENQERLDLALSILKSPLHQYRHNGKVYQ